MRISQETLLLPLLVALALALAAPTQARVAGTVLADGLEGTACECKTASRAGLLLRGADQVQQCSAGYYCDCATKKVAKCWSLFRWNEEEQDCGYVDCEDALRPAAPSTARPAEDADAGLEGTACQCPATGGAGALLRGADQVRQCSAGFYCDCGAKKVAKCWSLLRWNEEEQDCGYVDCEDALRPATPATAFPVLPTIHWGVEADEDDEDDDFEGTTCACPTESLKGVLLRGDDQVQHCLDGYYCDCRAKTVAKCWSILRWNEEEQECGYVECEAALVTPSSMPSPSTSSMSSMSSSLSTPSPSLPPRPDQPTSTAEAESSETKTPRPSWPSNSAWPTAASMPSLLLTLVVLVGLVNLGAIYAVSYFRRLRHYPQPPPLRTSSVSLQKEARVHAAQTKAQTSLAWVAHGQVIESNA